MDLNYSELAHYIWKKYKDNVEYDSLLIEMMSDSIAEETEAGIELNQRFLKTFSYFEHVQNVIINKEISYGIDLYTFLKYFSVEKKRLFNKLLK